MQHEIIAKEKLLDKRGNIAEPGYAKHLLWEYDRRDIKAGKLRIKEWDYYYIGNDDCGLCLTISDVGFCASHSVSLLGFGEEPYQMNDSVMQLMTLGKVGMPATSEKGDVGIEVDRLKMEFKNDGDVRVLSGCFKDYCKTGKELTFSVKLSNFPDESMVIATPFKKDKHFYYNQKINCMEAAGFWQLGDERYEFSKENGALGTLDWGRGVWTYDNTWRWGSGQMYLPDGSRFGFNLGYGFGDTAAATENMLFYNGKSHKLEDVSFNINKDREGNYLYMEPWKVTSSDGRIEFDFIPIIDRNPPTNLGPISMTPHQVFGRATGKAILDDGTEITFENKTVFAERVHNKW